MATETGIDTRNTDIGPLPPGVHPDDPSEYMGPGFGANPAAPPDIAGDRFTTGAPPWKQTNDKAFPVFQRASSDGSVQLVVPNASFNAGTAVACGRQKGRQAVTLTVPTLLANGLPPSGVVYGFTLDAVEAGGNGAGILNPGDSRTIRTEAPIWVGVIGTNQTGAVEVLIEFNPPGGSLGGE